MSGEVVTAGMPSASTPAPRASRQNTWSSNEVWHSWPLRWADRTARSLLLASLCVGGVTAAYLLPLLLSRPPALFPVLTFSGIGVTLLLVAAIVAPASRLYRLLAGYCIVLYAGGSAALMIILATELAGPTTYGQLDAIEFATFGVLVVAWQLVRMRHPLTVLLVVIAYASAGVVFFSRILPTVRAGLAVDTWAEQQSSQDESVVRWTLVGLSLILALLAWWFDGWMRALLPVANVAELHSSVSRAGDPQRVRYAGTMFALGLDAIAIALAIIAKLPSMRGRISERDDWWASIVLALATARLAAFIFLLACIVIWLQNDQYLASPWG